MIKKYLPTSLLGRTILIILIPVLLLQIGVSIVFFDRHWSKMTQRLAFAVTGEMIAAADIVDDTPDDIEKIARVKELMHGSLSLEMNYFRAPQIPPEEDFVYLNRFFKNPFLTMEDDLKKELGYHDKYEYSVVTVPLKKQVIVNLFLKTGVLQFKIPEGRLYSSSSYIFILWMNGLSLLLFTIAMLFMRNQIRPIYRLGVTAERLGRGIPVGKIKPSGAREVRQAAEAFINMQNRINQFVAQRTTMLAAVSHDLKTPLTRMKLQLELLDDSEDKEALRADIKDMEDMIEGYLAFAKGDGGEEMQRLSVNEIYDQICEDARRLGLSVNEERLVSEGLFLWGRPRALRRVFDNILSNAVRYGNKISLDHKIEGQDGEKTISFVIEDNGSGVDPDLIPELIKPFYRGETSRNRNTGGVGLGLAIAHDIVTAHGGVLKFEKSTMLGGLKVSVVLPL